MSSVLEETCSLEMVSEIKTGMALFLALLLNSGLLFVGAYAAYESVRNDFSVGLNYHLPDYVIPKSYDVQLMIPNKVSYENLEKILDFSGEINVKIQVLQPTQNISLHAHPYIKINNSLMKNDIMDVYEPMKYEHSDETHILILYFNSTLLKGDYILHMKFENSLYNDGFYKTSYYMNEEKKEKGEWLIVSRFKAIGTRRMFPCWDEPKFRANFSISLYHHENQTSETNMPLKKMLLDENNMIWAIFHTTPEMPTYLVAVMISAYHGSPYERGIANIWCREFLAKHLDFALDIADKVKMHFHYLLEFSTLKVEPQVKHVAIPGYQDDDMENWRLLFYRETDILYDEYIEPIARKIEIAYLVARKIAHQWFGNLVSPSWWSYLWLNDGITTLLAIDAIDKTLLNSHMLDLFVVQVQHESLYMDFIIEPLISEINNPSEINSLSPYSRYIKAPAILRMLQHTLTIDVFQEGLDIYLRNHMFKSATLDDFWTAMQTALDESSFKEYRFNVSQRMANWIKDPSYPIINVIQDNPKLVVASLTNSDEVKSRWIPVSITTQSESNFDQTFLPHGQWIGLRNLTYCTFYLPYEENGWIIANLKQAGYYRVNYDSKNWQKIADFLDSPNYSEIDVLNRAQIIDDGFYLMETEQLRPIIFWKLASYLSQETEYIAWYPMIKALQRMSNIFSLPENKIKKKIMYILDNFLMEIKYEDEPDDSDHLKILRKEIVNWACILGIRECTDKAQQKMKKFLTDPEKYKILPPWKEWTFCNGMKSASETLWIDMFHEWQKTRDNTILKSLTCSENYHTIRVILSTLGMEYKALDLNLKNRINIYFFIIAKHIRNNKVLEDILNNFQEFKPKEVSTMAALIHIINHVNSEEQLDKISIFVSKNLRKLNMERLNSGIQRKIEIRQSQIKNQINYLHKLHKLRKLNK